MACPLAFHVKHRAEVGVACPLAFHVKHPSRSPESVFNIGGLSGRRQPSSRKVPPPASAVLRLRHQDTSNHQDDDGPEGFT